MHNFLISRNVEPTLSPDLRSAAMVRKAAGQIAYESALALAERGTKKVEGGWVWSFDRRELTYTALLKFSEDYAREFLSYIEQPTTIILAEEGLYKDHEKIEAKAQLIKNHTLHYVPGAHHVHVHMDYLQIVAPLILNFFKTK